MENKSLTLTIDHENAFPSFFQNVSKANQLQNSFISLRNHQKKKIELEKLYINKTCPLLHEKKSSLIVKSKPNSQFISEKKQTFFSQNSFNINSFIGNINVKSSDNIANNENISKEIEVFEENGFNLSFHDNQMQENDMNLNPSMISEINQETPSDNNNNDYHTDTNIIMSNENNLISQNNNRRFSSETGNRLINNQMENLAREANRDNLDEIYKNSLRMFVYKTLKNNLFLHLFLFSIIIKYQYQMNCMIIFSIAWTSDVLNLFYYGYKIFLSKVIPKLNI